MCFWALWATFGARYRLVGCHWKRLGQAELDLPLLIIFASQGCQTIGKTTLKRCFLSSRRPDFNTAWCPCNQKVLLQIWHTGRETTRLQSWGGFSQHFVVTKKIWANEYKVSGFWAIFLWQNIGILIFPIWFSSTFLALHLVLEVGELEKKTVLIFSQYSRR